MEQYWEARNSLPSDTLLMFRLGDFYEMFYNDAVEGAKILGITLTKRQDYPMAGVPYHAVDQYLPKLLAAGKKVAICEQDEIPKPGKLVKRSISRILTPGTTLEDNQLDSRKSNFTMAVDIDKSRKLFAAWLDLSTAEFYCAEFDNPNDFFPLFSACDPKEILLPENSAQIWAQDDSLAAWNAIFRTLVDVRPVTLLHDYRFEPVWGAAQIKETLGVLSLDGFGIPQGSRLTGPAGALIFYATENLRGKPRNIRALRKFSEKKCVLIDPSTQRNLEIFRSSSGAREGSLLSVMDRTQTAAGARLLESYLSAPTIDLDEISRRQNIVWELYSSPRESELLRECLSHVRDIPRILARLQNKLRNPRELSAIIADGFDAELDRLRGLSGDSLAWLSELESREQQRTGIKNLRIKYNGAFGYFIEVTKSYINLVPPEYIRKQTMTNAERYTTEELKTKEREILSARDLALAREEQLFNEIVSRVLEYAEKLGDAAEILAQIDVFRGWAELSREWDYCKPVISNSDTVAIEDGRHPVVEQMLRRDRIGLAHTESFVPNDTFISSSSEQIALITGPNMAGKSTYIRQIALIVLMAQTGCFVPARKCEIGVVDRIFSRVGASDELSRGNSTFMVEMNETANILNNATDKSLIILDEIGRGTSTYDGLSIAWAVVEFIHGGGVKGPKTLFATHYHEITKLEETLPRLVNYRVCVKEWNDEIIFVRKIEKGAADRSYGIQVARLAGLPQKVIDRAKAVLSELESEGNSIVVNLGEKPAKKTRRSKPEKTKELYDGESNFKQLSFF